MLYQKICIANYFLKKNSCSDDDYLEFNKTIMYR